MKQLNNALWKYATLVILALLVISPIRVVAAEETGNEPSFWERWKQTGADLYDKAKDGASRIADQVKEKAPEVIENIGDKIDEAQENVSEYRQSQEDQFWDWFEQQTGTKPASTSDSANDTTKNQETTPNTEQSPDTQKQNAELAPESPPSTPNTEPAPDNNRSSSEGEESEFDREAHQELVAAFRNLSKVGTVLIVVISILIVVLLLQRRNHSR